MKKINIIVANLSVLLILCNPVQTNSQNFSDKKIQLKTIDYKLDISIDYENEKLSGICSMTLINAGEQDEFEIPLLLYRLMKVKSIKDNNGNKIPFTQQVLSFEDWDVFQVNFITADLHKPLKSEQEKEIVIEYDGYLLGYSETGMSYVKDRITPEFTIIRLDAKAYPVIGYPYWAVNRAAGFDNFDYQIKVTVPDSLVVANGGKLIEKSVKNDKATYIYKNIKPAWRMDIAIAGYDVIENGRIKIFSFPEDSSGSKEISYKMDECIELFTSWWGSLDNLDSFSLIEIPDGWGSQTDVTSIIQTAAAFKNKNEYRQLYHEISHMWNDVRKLDEFPCRWDEGHATFTEYLTVEKLENREVLRSATEKFYKALQERYKKHPEYLSVPMIDFGKENITGLSYLLGMIFFQVLYNIEGEAGNNNLFRSFYKEYNKSGATALQFIDYYKEHSKIDLTKFFDDWMFTSKCTDYIMNNIPVEEIAKLYK